MVMANLRTLPQELVDVQAEMEAHADNYGLDYFPTIFEVVDVNELNAVAAYGGFPTRYPALAIWDGVPTTVQRLFLRSCKRFTS